MLTRLDAYSPNISVDPYGLVLGGSPEIDPYQIRNITGLGPVSADINTSKLGINDGESYRDSTVGKRNIVITIGLNPDWSIRPPEFFQMNIEALRQTLYLQFMPKTRIRLVFTSTHMPDVEIVGYVETFEPNLFSADHEYQISIICPEPYFVDTADTVITSSTLDLDDDIPDSSAEDIIYTGNVPTGLNLQVAKGAGSSYSGRLLLVKYKTVPEIMVANNIDLTDTSTFEVNTIRGQKYARMTYSDTTPSVNMLANVTTSSSWFELVPGLNKLQVMGQADNEWTLTYRNRYGGL